MQNKSYIITIVIGCLISLITVILLFYFNKDMNDQNEILFYAVLDLINGNNPYSQQYLLNFNKPFFIGEYYEYIMFYGYPPLSLLLYLPIIIFPYQIGYIQFQPIIYIENMILLFIMFKITYQKNNYLGYFVWWNPLLYLSCYNSFLFMYLFPLLAVINIQNKLKCGVYVACSVLIYHLYIFMAIMITFYHLFRLGKSKLYIIGIIIPMLSLIPFILWNWKDLVKSLLFSSINRFNSNIIQYGFILTVIIISLIVVIYKDSQLIMNNWLILFYIIENCILNIGLEFLLPHYLTLIVPFIFHNIMIITEKYDTKKLFTRTII